MLVSLNDLPSVHTSKVHKHYLMFTHPLHQQKAQFIICTIIHYSIAFEIPCKHTQFIYVYSKTIIKLNKKKIAQKPSKKEREKRMVSRVMNGGKSGIKRNKRE